MSNRQESTSIQKLFKSTNAVKPSKENGIENLKIKMQRIWLELADSDLFDAKEVANQLLEINNTNSRLLYSQLSANFFNLEENERFAVLTNADNLVNYAYEERNENPELLKMTIKIYDHCQLVAQQIESIHKFSALDVENAKKRLEEETKGVEKEYISILGIFSSVVLAFMGGISYSSSVLSAINNASIFRLILVTDMLGFVLTNIIYLLLSFIAKINQKNGEKLKINTKLIIILNIIYGIILGAVIIIRIFFWPDNVDATL